MMKHIRNALLAGFALVISTSAGALAADLGPEVYKPAAEASYDPCCAAYYFKGFLGMTNETVDDLSSDVIKNGNFQIISEEFESTPLFGIGLGYEWNEWLRFDVTGEFRGNATFHGLDRFAGGANFLPGTNEYTAVKEDWLGLANAYIDLGTFWGFTPYVGAGVGLTNVRLEGFRDVNVPNGAVFFAHDNDETNFAWALYGGVSYDVTPRFTIDMAYRFVDMDQVTSGRLNAFDGSPSIDGITLEDLHSHDVMVSARYKFGCCTEHASYK